MNEVLLDHCKFNKHCHIKHIHIYFASDTWIAFLVPLLFAIPCTKSHQVTTMLATFKNVLFPGHNWHSSDKQSVRSSVSVVSRWLWPGNWIFLEMASMVTWWIVACCAVTVGGHICYFIKLRVYLCFRCEAMSPWYRPCRMGWEQVIHQRYSQQTVPQEYGHLSGWNSHHIQEK